MPLSSLPPWLIPALILHAAMVAVLVWPAWRAFSRAGTGGLWALVLIVPVLGLIGVAVLLGVSVLRRAGWSAAWAILAVIPLVNVVFLWLLAYARWTRTVATPVEEPRTARRDEPKLAAASARGSAPAAEPTLSRPSDDGYEALDPHNRGFVDEVDSPPEIDDEVELREQTMIAGAAGPKKPGIEPTLQTPGAPAKPLGEKTTERPKEAAPAADEDGAPDADAGEKAPDTGEKAPDTGERAVHTGEKAAEPEAPPSDEMSLAAGVLSDLDAAAAEPPVEPPAPAGPGDEARTVPVRHEATGDGNRVWTLRGVNARSANIEVTIREEDLAQSATGILVGRSNRVDFIIGDESVSRNHARFVYQDGSLCVEDLDSMNGTWVDGEQLESNKPVPVGDDGEVEFGKIKLLVTEGAG